MIWTRAADDWDDDAVFFANYQGKVLRIPCIATEPLSHAQLPPVPSTSYTHVVATSVKAVNCLEQNHAWHNHLRTAQFHCFGEATHAALVALGVKVVLHQVAAAASLCAKLIATLPRTVEHADNSAPAQQSVAPTPRVMVLSAAKPAFPFTATLQQQGIDATQLTLYRTLIAARWADGRELLASQCEELARTRHIVCLASPSAVLGFVHKFQNCRAAWQRNFQTIAIGTTTATVANKHFERCDTCAEPTIAKLVARAIEASKEFI